MKKMDEAIVRATFSINQHLADELQRRKKLLGTKTAWLLREALTGYFEHYPVPDSGRRRLGRGK